MSMHIIYYTNIRSQTIITSTVNSLIHEYFPILIHISIQLFKKHTKFLKTIEKIHEIIRISIHLLKKHTKFLNTIVKYVKRKQISIQLLEKNTNV